MIKARQPCLVDTNILLRLANTRRQEYLACQTAITRLKELRCPLFFTLQNASEFWNVSTRPAGRNGHGLPPAEVEMSLNAIERNMTFLPDNEQVYRVWRRLVATHNIRGVQVHDAKLAASMIANSVSHILTFNTTDFARFPAIEAVLPAEVQP